MGDIDYKKCITCFQRTGDRRKKKVINFTRERRMLLTFSIYIETPILRKLNNILTEL